jgi:DNA-directed RNA polymerase specialized sigma24 family protein
MGGCNIAAIVVPARRKLGQRLPISPLRDGFVDPRRGWRATAASKRNRRLPLLDVEPYFQPNEVVVRAVPQVETLADPAADIYEILSQRHRDEALRRLVRGLPDRERDVICARFGLGPYDSHSLRQLAAKMEVSLRTAWTAERRALQIVRDAWDHERRSDGWLTP